MRPHLRLAAVVGAAALSTVAVAPAAAAAPLAQSGANAITVSVAGNEQGSGNVTAKNDGSGEQKTGDTAPPISVLKGQDLIKAGVLAQEASATVTDRSGRSAACAGIAGNGGSVAQVGDSRCLDPGQPLGLAFGNLDLSDTLVVDPESALGPLAEANAPLQQVLGQITGPLADAIADTPLAPSGLGGTLGAIEGSCVSENGRATGDANIVDTRLTLNVAGQEVVLANLPANPPPNTEVPVNLDEATAVILGAVRTQLETMLAAPGAGTGPLAPLAALPDALQEQVVEALVDATRDQLLAPLGENVVRIILNKQTRTGPDQIRVTALDLALLPALEDQLDAPLVGLQLGNVVCGPSGQARAAAAPAAPAPTALPTAVSAGLEHAPQTAPTQHEDGRNAIVLGAFAVLVVTGAGFVTYRRLRA
jgi:hypothetical protein